MIAIQDLLHRMQWDPAYGKADFEIGYFDRVTGNIVRVPFRHVRFGKGEHFAFEAVEADGSVHTVPLHRVREVWRNGEVIWQRARPQRPV
jgi:uncharacterized protein (UPF0248 family)